MDSLTVLCLLTELRHPSTAAFATSHPLQQKLYPLPVPPHSPRLHGPTRCLRSVRLLLLSRTLAVFVSVSSLFFSLLSCISMHGQTSVSLPSLLLVGAWIGPICVGRGAVPAASKTISEVTEETATGINGQEQHVPKSDGKASLHSTCHTQESQHAQ